MIFEGNYNYNTISDIMPELIDAFVEYYYTKDGKPSGEDYSKVIKGAISDTVFYPYHTKETILGYYDKYILKYKDEILQKFYYKFRGFFRQSIQLESMLFDKNGLSLSNFNIAVLGSENILKDKFFTEGTRKRIKRYREKLYSLLKIKGNEHEKFEMLKAIKKTFDKIVRLVELEHPCDVFNDVDKIECNQIELTKKFFSEVEKAGFKIPNKDKEILDDKHFTIYDTCRLATNGILFNNELNFKGYIDSFTTESNEILKHGSRLEKDRIILNRLLYLNCFKSTEYKYFDREAIYDLEDDIYTAMQKGCNLDKEVEHMLYKEYAYQKNRKIKNTRILNMSQEEFEKTYRTGQFIPEELANTIETIRDDYSDLICADTKFYKQPEKYDIENVTFKYYINKNINDQQINIYLNEDYLANPDSYISILIHELNHAISYRKPIEINTRSFKDKNNLSITGYKKKGLIVDEDSYVTTDVEKVLEYVNERQTQEILEIFKRKLKESKKNIKVDKVLKSKDYNFECLYDYYGVVLDDFYRTFKNELKDNNVQEGQNIYFKYKLPMSKLGSIIELIKYVFNRTFNKENYYKNGILDVFKIQELNYLASEIEKIASSVEVENKEDFLQYKLDMFKNADEANRCRELIENSQGVMDRICKDYDKAQMYKAMAEAKRQKKEDKYIKKYLGNDHKLKMAEDEKVK